MFAVSAQEVLSGVCKRNADCLDLLEAGDSVSATGALELENYATFSRSVGLEVQHA